MWALAIQHYLTDSSSRHGVVLLFLIFWNRDRSSEEALSIKDVVRSSRQNVRAQEDSRENAAKEPGMHPASEALASPKANKKSVFWETGRKKAERTALRKEM